MAIPDAGYPLAIGHDNLEVVTWENREADRWVASVDTKLCIDLESSKATRPMLPILSSIYIVSLVWTLVIASK